MGVDLLPCPSPKKNEITILLELKRDGKEKVDAMESEEEVGEHLLRIGRERGGQGDSTPFPHAVAITQTRVFLGN